jgi:phosphosulfolactate synthase
MDINLTNLPERPSKPRTEGLTIIQDDGMSLSRINDIISTSGHLIDMVRILPGALCSGEPLRDRIDSFKQAGIDPFISGILFEAAFIRNNVNEYLDMLEVNGISFIEVSDGIVEIPLHEKVDIIKNLSGRFTVFSKIGARFKNFMFRNKEWKEHIVAESEAGSRKLIIEGGEGGTSRVMLGEIDINLSLVNYILSHARPGDVIWETPLQRQQVWFINKFGANVNLADIIPQQVLNLESMRLGIHWNTFLNNISEFGIKAKLRKVDPMSNIDFQI